MKSIYLDYAAATPLDSRVLKAMQPYLTERFANPSSMHSAGRSQRAALEAARAQIAKELGAKPAEIIFTAGSTEAATLAIQGVLTAVPGSMVMSAVEHEAVLENGSQHPLTIVPVGPDGLVDPVAVAAAVTDETVLVAVQYANNEIGIVQPIAKIAAALDQIKADRLSRGLDRPLYFYCDAAQAGLLSLQVSRLGVDLLSMGATKLYGPSASGFLYVRTGVELQPVVRGGGQEGGLRSGTESVAAAVGLAAALEFEQSDRSAESKRQAGLRDRLWQQLQVIDGIKLNGSLRYRLQGNLNFTIPGAAGETLVAHLDAAGFAVATGSACSAADEEPSRVLLAIGCSREEATCSLRVTIGRPTTAAELDSFTAALIKIAPRVRELSAT